jgi:hypothetical protein
MGLSVGGMAQHPVHEAADETVIWRMPFPRMSQRHPSFAGDTDLAAAPRCSYDVKMSEPHTSAVDAPFPKRSFGSKLT